MVVTEIWSTTTDKDANSVQVHATIGNQIRNKNVGLLSSVELVMPLHMERR